MLTPCPPGLFFSKRKQNEKIMKRVHRKEAREGHWASEGMPEKARKGGKGERKREGEDRGGEKGEQEKGKGKGGRGGGVLEAVVAG